MKKMMIVAMLVAVASVFTGCEKKEQTPGQKLDKAINKVEQKAADGAKAVEKTAGDLKDKAQKAADQKK